jgi:hypothetical protein
MDLSIFSFGRMENARFTQPRRQSTNLQGAEAFDGEDENRAAAMVLDLENLTPETLEAFFPSEHAVAS